MKTTLQAIINQCLSCPETEEATPFGPDTLVYKVCGKMFAATDPSAFPSRMNLKCDPDEAIELRDRYEAVQPGYHMNKKHWNTIYLDDTLPPDLVAKMVGDSYRLVVMSLKKAERERVLAKLE